MVGRGRKLGPLVLTCGTHHVKFPAPVPSAQSPGASEKFSGTADPQGPQQQPSPKTLKPHCPGLQPGAACRALGSSHQGRPATQQGQQMSWPGCRPTSCLEGVALTCDQVENQGSSLEVPAISHMPRIGLLISTATPKTHQAPQVSSTSQGHSEI